MKILTMDLDEISKEVKHMQNSQKQIKNDLLKICWFMRGGISIEEAYYLGNEELEIIGNIIKENLETTKKTGMAFF